MGRKPKPAEVRAKSFTARASGATLKQAAQAAGVSRSAGHYWLAQSGGVRPRVRQPRPALRLSLEEREMISRGLAQKKTFTAIAVDLGRSVSTVSREVARNSGVIGYRAARADRLATARTARPRAGKLADEPGLRLYLEDKLALRWSPEPISERLLVDFPRDPGMRVSHETIYTSLFVQTKAVLRSELSTHLRSKRVRRRPQRRTTVAVRNGRIPNMVPIQLRPVEVLERLLPGHREGDLLVGRYSRSHLVTLVERHSRYLLALALADARTSTVITALSLVGVCSIAEAFQTSVAERFCEFAMLAASGWSGRHLFALLASEGLLIGFAASAAGALAVPAAPRSLRRCYLEAGYARRVECRDGNGGLLRRRLQSVHHHRKTESNAAIGRRMSSIHAGASVVAGA
jgi:IS30 family transposase